MISITHNYLIMSYNIFLDYDTITLEKIFKL